MAAFFEDAQGPGVHELVFEGDHIHLRRQQKQIRGVVPVPDKHAGGKVRRGGVEIALEHHTGPSSLVFARQALPHVRSDRTDTNLSRRGAYVIAQASGGMRQVSLLATGSEVAVALAARLQLQADGIPTAVVSMPSWELFEAQDTAYQDSVLGPGTVRVGCEAAVRLGWDRWLGARGGFVGMKSFGASGPAEDLYRYFGITPEAIVAEARRLMG